MMKLGHNLETTLSSNVILVSNPTRIYTSYSFNQFQLCFMEFIKKLYF